MTTNKQIISHLALILVSLFYGSNYSIAKIAMPTYLQPFGFILLRVSISCVLFWLISTIFPYEPIKIKKDYLKLFFCAILGVGTNQLLFFKGLSYSSPITASLILTTVPITVLIVSFILKKETINLQKIIGILLGSIGAILLISQHTISFSDKSFLGNFLILLNTISYGTYLVIAKSLFQKYNALTIVKWIFLFATFIVFPFGIGELQIVNWHDLPSTVWLVIAFVIIGVTLITYFLNGWALQHVNSSTVGIYIYLQPVFATIIAIVLKKDELTWDKALLSLLIFTGIYLVTSPSLFKKR